MRRAEEEAEETAALGYKKKKAISFDKDHIVYAN